MPTDTPPIASPRTVKRMVRWGSPVSTDTEWGKMMIGVERSQDSFYGRYRDVYFDTSNLRLHYTDWNPEGSETIILVHGLNVQLHTWDPIAADLATDYRVICPDLRGHGESQWASEGYHLDYFVSDLDALADHAGLAKFDLVGHSLGARIAIRYAGLHLDRIRTVTLSDTGPEAPRAGTTHAKGTVEGANSVKGFRDHAEALEHFDRAHPEWRPDFRELHARYQVRRNWAGKLVLRADPDLFWILGSIGKNETVALWESASKITAPSLLVVGETSPFFDDDLVSRMQREFPALTVQYFKTGHYVPRERPDEFITALREFIVEHR